MYSTWKQEVHFLSMGCQSSIPNGNHGLLKTHTTPPLILKPKPASPGNPILLEGWKGGTGKIVPNRQEALVSRKLLEHQSWFYGSVCFEHITIVFRSASVLLNLVVGVPFSVDMVAAPIISSLDALHSLYRHPYFLLNYLLRLWLLSFTPLYPVLFSEV